jgi:hypothetical protein
MGNRMSWTDDVYLKEISLGFISVILRAPAIFLLIIILLSGCQRLHPGTEPINRQESRLIYTKHARCRMDCRHITEQEIKEILHDGEINFAKRALNHILIPTCHEGYTREGQHPVHWFATSGRDWLL